MSIKKFDKLFGFNSTIEEEKEKFVNRIENSIFELIENRLSYDHQKYIFGNVCQMLGRNFDDELTKKFRLNTIPNLNSITEKDFFVTLRVVVAVYSCCRNYLNKIADLVNSSVQIALNHSSLDIGIRWVDGVFYPSGDNLLDEELIDKPLNLLDRFPSEKKNFEIALEHYNANRLNDTLTNCFIVIEGITREILGNKKTLDNNQQNLIEFLKFSKPMEKILRDYLNFAHEFGRHASDKRHEINPIEVEAILYLTGVIIRAISSATTGESLNAQ